MDLSRPVRTMIAFEELYIVCFKKLKNVLASEGKAYHQETMTTLTAENQYVCHDLLVSSK